MLLQLLENHSLLIFVDVFDRFEHMHLIAILFRSLYQRLNIFRETRTSIATTRIKEFAADTRVATDALAHHIHVGTDKFAKIGNVVHKRDAGGKH